jgi:hypothetical protein
VILLNADAILTVDERIALSTLDSALPGAGTGM